MLPKGLFLKYCLQFLITDLKKFISKTRNTTIGVENKF